MIMRLFEAVPRRQSRTARMERKLAQPGFGMAVLLVLMALGIQVVLAIPLVIINVIWEQALHLPPPQWERHPVAIGCINLLAFAGAIALALYWNRLPFRRAFPIKRITPLQLLGAVVIVLGAGVLLSEADNACRALLPPPEFMQKLFRDMFYSEERLFSRVFLLVIVAPITEELLFRGIILRGLLSRYRPAVAVVLTALLFAALHLNPWQFISALFLGSLFGWFYLRTGSVALCVLAHAMANGLTILVPLLPWDIPGLTGTPASAKAEFQPWWLDLFGMAVLLAGLWLVRRATPPARPPPIPPLFTEASGPSRL
jgi:membrane protease YdiL (CAAX protease family)